MNKKKNMKLTLSKENESNINAYMGVLDKTLKLRRQVNKNFTYKQNFKEHLKIWLSEEFQSDLKKMKGVN